MIDSSIYYSHFVLYVNFIQMYKENQTLTFISMVGWRCQLGRIELRGQILLSGRIGIFTFYWENSEKDSLNPLPSSCERVNTEAPVIPTLSQAWKQTTEPPHLNIICYAVKSNNSFSDIAWCITNSTKGILLHRKFKYFIKMVQCYRRHLLFKLSTSDCDWISTHFNGKTHTCEQIVT